MTIATPGPAPLDANISAGVVRIPACGKLLPAMFMMHLLTRPSLNRVRFIHCCQLRVAGFACLWAKRLLGIPYGLHIYGGERSKFADNPFWRSALRPVIREAAALFPNSRWTREQMLDYGVPEERMSIAHPGVDTERFSPPVDREALRTGLGLAGRRVVLTVCRLDAHKGVDRTLRAVATLVEKHPDLLFVIAGRGPMRDQLERDTAELGLSDHVRFLGFVPDEDLRDWYGAADLFVMPSRLGTGSQRGVEGFGMTYIEANVCGTPVIGGRSGGVADAVEDGVSGLLVDPEDVADIARGTDQLLSDPDLARRLGRQGRARAVSELSGEVVAGRLHDAVARHLSDWAHTQDTVGEGRI